VVLLLKARQLIYTGHTTSKKFHSKGIAPNWILVPSFIRASFLCATFIRASFLCATFICASFLQSPVHPITSPSSHQSIQSPVHPLTSPSSHQSNHQSIMSPPIPHASTLTLGASKIAFKYVLPKLHSNMFWKMFFKMQMSVGL
jgi:hypothetical protein